MGGVWGDNDEAELKGEWEKEGTEKKSGDGDVS